MCLGSKQQSQMVARLEVLMKWGRGESFPALVFGNRRLTKTLDTRSHLRGCSCDNPQGHCSANTRRHIKLYWYTTPDSKPVPLHALLNPPHFCSYIKTKCVLLDDCEWMSVSMFYVYCSVWFLFNSVSGSVNIIHIVLHYAVCPSTQQQQCKFET